MSLTLIIMYAAVGTIAGLIAGLIGIGGGIVTVPLLHIVLNYQGVESALIHKIAVGTSLAGIMCTVVSSAMAHHRRGSVDWKTVFHFTPGTLVGAWCGAYIASRMPSQYLQIVFVVFLSFVIINMLADRKPKPTRQLPGPAGLSTVGCVIGCIAGLVGIGGGTMSIPYLLWNNMPMLRTIGSAAAISFPAAVSGAIGNVFNGWNTPGLPNGSLGFVYLPGLLCLVSMSMLMAPAGARLAHSLPAPTLKKCFACVLILVAAKMLYDAVQAL